MPFIYTISNLAFLGVLRAFSDWKVTGREAVLPHGPLLVVSNHQSNIDPALLSVSLPRRLHFMAKKEIFKGPLLRAYLRSYGAYPLDREGPDVAALRWGLRVLETDKTLVIFPEGTRNPGGLGLGLSGVALLALRSQAPILPIAISGTGHMQGLWRLACPSGKIRVTIGDPFSLPVIEGKVRRPQLESLADMIMLRVASLLPEGLRGAYRTGSPNRTLDFESKGS